MPHHPLHKAYLAYLIHELRLLPVIPIKNSDRTTRLPLQDVYVQLRVIERAQSEQFQRMMQGEQERTRSDAKQEAPDERVFALFGQPLPPGVATFPGERVTRMLLIGDAGSGKTTTLHYGALVLADALLYGQRQDDDALKQLQLQLDPPPLPLYLRLTLAMRWLTTTEEGQRAAQQPEPLLAWLDSQVAPQVASFVATADPVALPDVAAWQAALQTTPLSTLVRDGGCLLLLDGLDETGDAARRRQMQAWIVALAQAYPHNSYLVASRPFAASALGGFLERHLSPLNAAEMRQLLHQWFAAAYAQTSEQRQRPGVATEVGYLWDILEQNARLFDMCSNPLLLTSVALLVYTGVGLPRERAELYNRLLYLLLETWRVQQLLGGHQPTSQAERPIIFKESVGSIQTTLQHLAHWMQQHERREATRDEIVALLAPEYALDMAWTQAEAEAYVVELIESLAVESGILQKRDRGFSFTHYTLQEYLTARSYDNAPDAVATLLALRGEARWRETILLAVGHWATTSGGMTQARQLLQGLLDAAPSDPEALLLAGAALDDADAGRVRQLASVRRAILEALRASAALTPTWADVAHPDPRIRNRAATLLDRLDADQERPGLDLTHADYWAARIEPGRFSMGDDASDEKDEKPQFDCTIKQPYALARFPVTNRHYLIFMDSLAGRGPDERARIAADELLTLMAQHQHFIHKLHPRLWPGKRYRSGEGNYPMMMVTWYAASAFAWWANHYLLSQAERDAGALIRLPTEAEWERAAAYPLQLNANQPRAGKRIYPWGDNLSEQVSGPISATLQANIWRSKTRSPSVVGIFPHGAAACGAEDLAGNVWEWCSTPYQDYPLPDNLVAEMLYTKHRIPNSSFVLRGDSWGDNPADVRCAFRGGNASLTRIRIHLGFRLARLFSLP
ncbi:MAG: NACHT domain-containing protein [Candidatus Viridilinea halotolerans]|uniref:NACHT domain-containing protein n=1 Tax=Candidatus Viridilinea halotolerans TaxID=2491704 RepID=A0A426U3L0_9CHLR|nr:MAG: NACHT domain-containing protein [Candidatus Viridilinea halotolerans]